MPPSNMMATYHLLRSPRNAERLRQAIAEVEAGEVVTATLRDGLIAGNGECHPKR